MKKIFFYVLMMLSATVLQAASLDFSRTLRVDCIFAGTDRTAEIYVSELRSLEGWAGRRVNLDQVPVRGNGQIKLKTPEGKVLYASSFSSLFQEWQTTEEAVTARKSFENVFLVPMPSDKAVIEISLFDVRGNISASLTYGVDPDDILIRPAGTHTPEHRYLHRGGSSESCIDVAFVAEGYTAEERELFYEDARIALESFWNHEPYTHMKDRFNFVAVALESEDSGVSIPGKQVWKHTALGSNFDTFYSERYLTTLNLKDLHDSMGNIPYEHFIILANTDNYGGGGVYNSYMLTTAHHQAFRPVVVHEFGHSFAGLADEYYYDDMFVQSYYPDIEPWEKNLTTLCDFGSKWKDMMKEKTPVPTPQTPENADVIGVYEGGGYQSKGVYRGYQDCRMKTNGAKDFCPVCQRAISDMILFYTEERPQR